MKKEYLVYLLFSHSGSTFSRAINLFTDHPYTHVSIALDENLDQVYSFGRLNPYNPFFAGFVREDIHYGTFSRFPNTTCSVYALKITEEQYTSITKEIDRFRFEGHKYTYNFLGILTATANYPLSRKYKYFCSQFVSEVFLKSGIELTQKHPGLTSPMDILEYGELEPVFSGYLREYRQPQLEVAIAG
ncbi:hypothetical protein [Gudongella sp. DL1XJH-153]|uniref:hypothetical protein n=1 Tax=Gudongella sp. DL1XJH-153 TaxID=3409804 RepID=UPI003BB7EA7C